ncbi:MAG: hypothetical protein DI611_10585 [Brachybacterium faecium]|nr:MAG: hypothetical protein DI611_10585 [Brachybacterium faecium]
MSDMRSVLRMDRSPTCARPEQGLIHAIDVVRHCESVIGTGLLGRKYRPSSSSGAVLEVKAAEQFS